MNKNKNKAKNKKKLLIPKPKSKPKTTGKKTTSLNNKYISTILNLQHSNMLPQLPNFSYSSYHVCKRKAILNYTVNSAGNLYLEFTPSILANTGSNSTVSPFLAINNPNFTDLNATLSFTTGGGLCDLTAASTLCLDPNAFHNAMVTGFHIKLSATGVSTSNRSGFITMCETIDDTVPFIDNASALSYTTLTSAYNRRNLKAQIQSDIKLEQDLATAYTNSFEYTWVPNFPISSATLYDFDVNYITGIVNLDVYDMRKLGVFISGANPSTIIRVDVTVMYQATPTQSVLSQYPVSYSDDFTDVNKQIQKLSRMSDLRLRVTESHLSGYIGGITQPNVVVKQNP